MKQKLLVQKCNGKVEFLYDVFYDEQRCNVTLQRSPLGKMWSKEWVGKNAALLHNHGNGLKITIDGVDYNLDYSQADYMFQTLKLHYKLYAKARPNLVMEDRLVDKVADIDKPKPVKKHKPTMEEIREAISEMDEEEVMLVMDASQERLVDRGWQWGDILYNVFGWLNGHAPGAREEYNDGGHPVFFYGADEIAPKVKKK